jgi:DNA polymerase-4
MGGCCHDLSGRALLDVGSPRSVRRLTLKVKFNDFESITRSRSVPGAISSREDLERLSFGLLRNEISFPKPVRLLGISLSSLQKVVEDQPQFDLPI